MRKNKFPLLLLCLLFYNSIDDSRICYGFQLIGRRKWTKLLLEKQPDYYKFARRNNHGRINSGTSIRVHDDDVFNDDDDVLLTIKKQNSNDIKESVTMVSSSFGSSCSFSMKFPRYRIDLTTPSSTRKPPTNKNKSFFQTFISSPKKEQIQKYYASSANKKKDDDGTVNVIEWYPNESTLQAYSTLWNVLARHLVEKLDTNNNATTKLVVACFPDADPSVIRNWYEIVTWMQQQFMIIQDDDDKKRNNDIHVTYNESLDIPRIELKIIRSNNILSDVNNPSSSFVNTTYDHDVITKRMQAWVKRILVEQGICPFTKTIKRSGQGLADVGVPVGKIAYYTSQASGYSNNDNSLLRIVQLQADAWNAIVDMILVYGSSGPDGISSILLAAPGFDDDFALWAGPIFAMLEAGVIAAQCSEQVGVVCFHPLYATPDGSTWPGFGQMHSVPRLQKWYEEETKALFEQQQKQKKTDQSQKDYVTNGMKNNGCPINNTSSSLFELSTNEIAAGGAWQRRTPHATINVLRADQLAAAEKKRNTPALYTRNIRQLIVNIGLDQLSNDLQQERELL